MTKLIKQLKEQPGFSESESMIADFLLENYRGLAALSTRQLAKLTYTSSAAIVRFAQKMGFEGYTEFKIQFVAEILFASLVADSGLQDVCQRDKWLSVHFKY